MDSMESATVFSVKSAQLHSRGLKVIDRMKRHWEAGKANINQVHGSDYFVGTFTDNFVRDTLTDGLNGAKEFGRVMLGGMSLLASGVSASVAKSISCFFYPRQ